MREWTVFDLIQALQQFGPTMKINIVDPDTSWTISKFQLVPDDEGVLWIQPSGYEEMTR